VETRNLADGLCYTAEKSLKDAGDKVPEDLKKDIEGKIKSIRDNLQTDSMDTLKQKTQDLSNTLQKIGEYMYKQGSQDAGSQSQNPGDGKDNGGKGNDGDGKKDEPVEGEIVE